MKNPDAWHPTKYSFRNGAVRATHDRRYLAPSSWLIADSVARKYSIALPRYARGRLVDLGCGRVPLFLAYRELVSAVTCVDWPQTMHGVDHVDIECDISTRLPLGDESFDTIILSDVLEHIPEPLALWHELNRILAPGGTVLLNVPFLYWVHEAPHDYYRYTEYALRRYAERSEFDIVLLEPVGGSLEVLADIVGKHIVRIPLIGAIATRLLASAVALFGRSSIGQRAMTSSGARFPLGYFVVATKRANVPDASGFGRRD